MSQKKKKNKRLTNTLILVPVTKKKKINSAYSKSIIPEENILIIQPASLGQPPESLQSAGGLLAAEK